MPWQVDTAPGIVSTWLNHREFILHHSHLKPSKSHDQKHECIKFYDEPSYYGGGTKQWYDRHQRIGTGSIMVAYIAFKMADGCRCLNEPCKFANCIFGEKAKEELQRKIMHFRRQKLIELDELVNDSATEEENMGNALPYYNEEKSRNKQKFERRSVKHRNNSQKRVFKLQNV